MLADEGKSEARKQEEAGPVPEAEGHRRSRLAMGKDSGCYSKDPEWERNTVGFVLGKMTVAVVWRMFQRSEICRNSQGLELTPESHQGGWGGVALSCGSGDYNPHYPLPKQAMPLASRDSVLS